MTCALLVRLVGWAPSAAGVCVMLLLIFVQGVSRAASPPCARAPPARTDFGTRARLSEAFAAMLSIPAGWEEATNASSCCLSCARP